jgi:hypothetical protein
VTTSPSTLLQVRTDLVTRFQGYLDAAGITDCPVSRGKPGRTLPYRFVAIGTTADDGGVRRDQERAPYRQGSVDETYVLRVHAWQLSPGGFDLEDTIACTDQVWAIANVLDQGLRSDRTEWELGGLVTKAAFTGFDDAEWDDLEEGMAAEIVCRLTVEALRR